MICGPLPAPALTGMWKKGLPKMEFAKRMELFGVGIFSKLLELKKQQLAKGVHVVDLSVGTPNIPPAQHILDTMAREAADKRT